MGNFPLPLALLNTYAVVVPPRQRPKPGNQAYQ